jgi:hypothetical protein
MWLDGTLRPATLRLVLLLCGFTNKKFSFGLGIIENQKYFYIN